jgi:hypothetical protein
MDWVNTKQNRYDRKMIMPNDKPWSRIYIDHGLTIIVEIASKCEFETMKIYEENIQFYESNNLSYIPIITSLKYYDRESDAIRNIQSEQWVLVDYPAVPIMQRLEDNDFLLMYEGDRFHATDSGVGTINAHAPDIPQSEIYRGPKEILNPWPEYSEEVNDILEENGTLYSNTHRH